MPTTGWEIGLNTSPATNFTFSAAWWKLDIGSELVFSGDGGITQASSPSRRRGIELSAYYQPLSWLLIDADYAITRARFINNPAGDRIPDAVESVASVGVETQGTGRWSGGLRYRYLGPAPLIEDNSVRSHSTTIVNGEVGYAITPRIKLTLEGLNLLDSKANDITYFYDSKLADETAPVPDIHFHPVEPRNFRLTMIMQL